MGTGLSVFKGFSNIIVKASIDRDMSLQGFQEHGSKLVSHPYGQQCQSTLHKVCQSCVRLRSCVAYTIWLQPSYLCVFTAFECISIHKPLCNPISQHNACKTTLLFQFDGSTYMAYIDPIEYDSPSTYVRTAE